MCDGERREEVIIESVLAVIGAVVVASCHWTLYPFFYRPREALIVVI